VGRQGHLIAVLEVLLIGCAVLLVVGCAGVGSEAPQKEQGHTKATKQEQEHTEATKEQTRSPKATASEEARCEGTQPIDRYGDWVTNNVPSCPKGGLLSGTDKPDELDGLGGDDEIRGLGAKDDLIGGFGSDVIYGGPGNDFLKEDAYVVRDPAKSKDVLYGGPGNDELYVGFDAGDDVYYGGDGDDNLVSGKGEDVMYGGDGNDTLSDSPNDGQQDKFYCGKGKDHYGADKIDYVDSSCEKNLAPGAPIDPGP
jgi:hypothetical protein